MNQTTKRKMRSPESLKEFITARLTAAAEDIFVVFRRTIVEYEEEIDRQCRLLDMAWKPHIYLQRKDVPQQHVLKELEVVSEQQLCHKDRNPSLDRQVGDPPQIKENQEGEQELGKAKLTNHSEEELQNEKQLLSKNSVIADDGQHNIMDMVKKLRLYLNRRGEEGGVAERQLCTQGSNPSVDLEVPEPPQTKENQEGEQLKMNQEADTSMLTENCEGELQKEQQLLSKDSCHGWNQDTKVSEHVTVGLTANKKEMSVGEEEEIDGQDNIMDMVKKLRLYLNRRGEEEDVAEQQLCTQVSNPSVDQEEPEPPQTKENQEGEQLKLNQETDTTMLTENCEGELQKEQQLLSKDACVGGDQDAEVSEHVTVGLTANEEEMSVDEVEEVHGPHNIMNMVKKLHIRLNRIDVSQQHVHKKEEVLATQERNSSVDQEELAPPQEQTERQLTVRQETDTAVMAAHSEGELKNKCPLLSIDSQVAENQDTKVSEHRLSESTTETKEKKKLERKLTRRVNPKRKSTRNDCNREQQLLLPDSDVGKTQGAKGSEHIQEETTADDCKKIDRPCILQDMVQKPRIYLHRMDMPQQLVIKENVVTEQQLCNQERNSSLDRGQPEPALVKGIQEGEQLEETQKTDIIMLTDPSEGEVKDKQPLLSNDSHVYENEDTTVTKHVTEGLTVYEEMSVYVEKETDGQHSMMQTAPTLHIHLRRIDVAQQHVLQEEEVVAEQQLCDQERISCLVQEDPELPPMKEEQNGEQEMDTIILTEHSERGLRNQHVQVSKQEESVLTRKSNPKRRKMFQKGRNTKRKTSKKDF